MGDDDAGATTARLVMEAEREVECGSKEHLLLFVAPALAALVVLALVAPRLLGVDYELGRIELQPGRPFDWSLDRPETDEAWKVRAL